MKGSIIIALLLLVIFFPFGIIYIVWNSINATNFCGKCKKNAMIPEDSPRGKELIKNG